MGKAQVPVELIAIVGAAVLLVAIGTIAVVVLSLPPTPVPVDGNGGVPSSIACSDGTPASNCAVKQPFYCDETGNLVENFCFGLDKAVGTSDDCGCQAETACSNSGECVQITSLEEIKCSDGTLAGSCSATKPFSCDENGVLKNSCSACGCPDGYSCEASGSCAPIAPSDAIACSDGTSVDSCSTLKPFYCSSSGSLLTEFCFGPDRAVGTSDDCGCPQYYSCNSEGSCESDVISTSNCSDSSLLNTCSQQKPFYCNSAGTLVNNFCFGPDRVSGNADDCGCAAGSECLPDGSCIVAFVFNSCSDGTEFGSCSQTKPFLCNDAGILESNCSVCGCTQGFACNISGACSPIVPSLYCSNGTRLNSCSVLKPKYCNSSGELVDNCASCGCPDNYSCQQNGLCAPIVLPSQCLGGIPIDSCSQQKPLYCTPEGQLVNDCNRCGCPENLPVCAFNGACQPVSQQEPAGFFVQFVGANPTTWESKTTVFNFPRGTPENDSWTGSRTALKDLEPMPDGSGYFELMDYPSIGGAQIQSKPQSIAANLNLGDCWAKPKPVKLKVNSSVTGYYILQETGRVCASRLNAFGNTLNISPAKAVDLEIVANSSGNVVGYYILDSTGKIHNFGEAGATIDLERISTNAEVLDLELTPSGKGAFVLDSQTRIHARGDADALFFSGSNAPPVLPQGYAPKRISMLFNESGGLQGYFLFDSFGVAHARGIAVESDIPAWIFQNFEVDGGVLAGNLPDAEIVAFPAFADLSVDERDISVSGGKISATIKAEKGRASNIKVSFFEGDPDLVGRLLGSQTISALQEGQASVVQLNYVPPASSVHIHVIVDPDNTVTETKEQNNRAYKVVNRNFSSRITINGLKLMDGGSTWNLHGIIYFGPQGTPGAGLNFGDLTEWEAKAKKVIAADLSEMQRRNFNAVFVFGNLCNVGTAFPLSKDKVNELATNRFKWFIDQAELRGIRVFGSCLNDGIVPKLGGDGFSSVNALPAFNASMRTALVDRIEKYDDELADHLGFVAGFSFPDKISESLIPECNNVPACKQSWNDWLMQKYGTFSNLQTAWGGKLNERETSFGTIEAYWRNPFILRDTFAYPRRLDWLEFEYAMQERTASMLASRITYPDLTFLATDFESFFGASHKHEFTAPSFDFFGSENYAVPTFQQESHPFVGKNFAFDLGYAVALGKIWQSSGKPFYQVTSYGLVNSKQQAAKNYYNSIVPLLFTTGNAGVFYWDFGIQADRFNHFIRSGSPETGITYNSSEVNDAIELWGYAAKNFGIYADNLNASALILVNRPEFIIAPDGSGTDYTGPMNKVPAIVNSLMQLGVPFDVKYSSVADKVISVSELGKYKLVIFVGKDVDLEHFEPGNNFGQSLQQYVTGGGTLFLFTEPKPTHRNEHYVEVSTPEVHSLVLNHSGSVNTSFSQHEWIFSADPNWSSGTKTIPVRTDLPPFTVKVAEFKFADYNGLAGQPGVKVLASNSEGKPTLLRITSGSGKVILSAYSTAFLRDFTMSDSMVLPDSSEANFLFEGLAREAGIPVEKLGSKVYNIKASGQRLILNEFSEGSQAKTITLNDCGYTQQFSLPPNGVLLVNPRVLVGNPSSLPAGATVVKRGPDNLVVARMPSGIRCG
ncbi:MAG: hypothetical protein QT03_C0001G1265 [archaeon GW2011_AR10]|uniref:CARDB domain-containing protein n=1 Tax=Candidatus Iainarchaeum sp. TaxID=3101447 RepID=A0A7J4IRJ6_9ARCH|nr:MAG: hypothetical protein QT03_C0001G1265 [archaeon GW2011_AR10]HIH08118.1 hypothetical protein [Candidatus Diapherotrites archaeon]